MADPYSVLGVSKDASDTEVRDAYRALARKYHPDKYINNPLADLASEKMKEINAAYDEIQKMRKEGTTSSSGYYNASSAHSSQSSQSGNYYQQGAPLNDVRRLIMQNRVVEAEELLNGIPISRRDGEWHFLKGTIFYKKGWLNEAYMNFERACQLNPTNMEYRQALSQLSYQRSAGTPYGHNTYGGQSTMMGCSGCNLCTNLICADCCCEMMGGDLLPC